MKQLAPRRTAETATFAALERYFRIHKPTKHYLDKNLVQV
jgi:hypothetical protein